MLEFAVFLRIEELLDAKLKDRKVQKHHLEILISKSKTDQYKKRHVVYISKIKSECCSLKCLELYLQKAQLDISNDKWSITKSGHKISKTKGISYSKIGEIFLHIEDTTTPENFGLSSLRWDGASAVCNNGIPDKLISKQSCRSSEKSRNNYTKDRVVKILTISNRTIPFLLTLQLPTNTIHRKFVFCFTPLFDKCDLKIWTISD